jgi:hypothetical protein
MTVTNTNFTFPSVHHRQSPIEIPHFHQYITNFTFPSVHHRQSPIQIPHFHQYITDSHQYKFHISISTSQTVTNTNSTIPSVHHITVTNTNSTFPSVHHRQSPIQISHFHQYITNSHQYKFHISISTSQTVTNTNFTIIQHRQDLHTSFN